MKGAISGSLLGVVLVTGCAVPNPASRMNELGEAVPGSWAATKEAQAGIDREWVDRFGDRALSRLVDEAMDHNRDLRVAAERVRQSRRSKSVCCETRIRSSSSTMSTSSPFASCEAFGDDRSSGLALGVLLFGDDRSLGNRNGESASDTDTAFHLEGAAEAVRQSARNRKTEPVALGALSFMVVYLEELFKNRLDLLRGDAGAGVAN